MNFFPASLIVLTGVALYHLQILWQPRLSRLDACMRVFVILFFFVLMSTEVLSYWHQLSVATIGLSWLLFCGAVSAVMYRFLRQSAGESGVGRVVADSRSEFPHIALCVLVAFLMLATLVTALVYPPNNYDSLTYHLPRVMHWAENHTVDFYFTNIPRQNYQPPLAEYALLHLYLLTHGDGLFNLVQWLSYCGIVFVAILLVRELGGNWYQQLVSALLVATLPMAVLQASTTQNDLVVSVFIGLFALYMLRLQRCFGWVNLTFCVLSLGLAMMAKGTAYIYCAPIGLILAWPLLFRADSFRVLAVRFCGLLAVAGSALIVNLPFYLRNHQYYGKYIGSTDESMYRNDALTIHYTLTNLVRNAALHLSTFSNDINLWLTNFFRSVLGDASDNPHSTWMHERFQLRASVPDEDSSGNLVQLLIVLILSVLMVYSIRRIWRERYVALVCAAFSASIFYCVLLKWQPWATRLHTPIFLLLMPVFALIFFCDSGWFRRVFGYVLLVCAFIWSLPFAFMCNLRSWDAPCLTHSSEVARLNAKPLLVSDYKSTVDYLVSVGVKSVGVVCDGNAVEYPLWSLRNESAVSLSMKFVHMSPSCELASMNPDCLLVLAPMGVGRLGAGYTFVRQYGTIVVYRSNCVVRPGDAFAFGSGWSVSEGGHRWSDGPISELNFNSEAAVGSSSQLTLSGFTHGAQSAVVILNGERVYAGILPNKGDLVIRVRPGLLVAGPGTCNRMRLEWSNAHVPNSADTRALAYAFSTLRISEIK